MLTGAAVHVCHWLSEAIKKEQNERKGRNASLSNVIVVFPLNNCNNTVILWIKVWLWLWKKRMLTLPQQRWGWIIMQESVGGSFRKKTSQIRSVFPLPPEVSIRIRLTQTQTRQSPCGPPWWENLTELLSSHKFFWHIRVYFATAANFRMMQRRVTNTKGSEKTGGPQD